MKIKNLSIGLIMCAFLASASFAHAQVPTDPDPKQMIRTVLSKPQLKAQVGSTSAGLRKNEGSDTTTDGLKTRAKAEIQRRITALNELLTRLNKAKHISSATKGTLSTQIQTEITNLTTLQAKIDADTDTATLKTDVASIVTSYRIFALFMPQVRLLTGADMLSEVADQMTTLSAKLQTRVTAAQSAGQNVSTLQTFLTDMQAKITDAKAQSLAIITDVSTLTPEGYPGNKVTLNTAKTKLETGAQDLKAAGQDARQVIEGLMKLTKSETTTGTPSGAMRLEKKPVIEESDN